MANLVTLQLEKEEVLLLVDLLSSKEFDLINKLQKYQFIRDRYNSLFFDWHNQYEIISSLLSRIDSQTKEG